jgi:peroxiredoxin Q/BCP
MMGNEYDGVFRTTFLIDENSKILNVFENVKPADHSKEILATIK